MIALDTNVLVRLIVADDEGQTTAVRRLLDRAAAEGARLLVSAIVLCETVWVLRSRYDFDRAEIGAAVSSVLATDQLQVELPAQTESALAAFVVGKGDIADYLIRERAQGAGAVAVATFDRPLLRETGFVHPDPATWKSDLELREATPRYGRRGRPRAAAAPTPASRS